MPKLNTVGIGTEKATGRYFIRLQINGKRYFETLPEDATIGDAVKRRDALRQEIEDGGSARQKDAPITITELLKLGEIDHAMHHRAHGTVIRFATAAKRLRAFFGGDRSAATIGAVDIKAYRVSAEQAGRAIGTTNVDLAFFCRCFRLAVDDERLVKVPKFQFVNPHNERDRYITDEEREKLLAALPGYLQPVFEVACLIGFRVKSELLGRRWSDYDPVARTLHVSPRTTKDKRARTVLLTGRALEIVEELRAKALGGKVVNLDGYVFTNAKGKDRIHDYHAAWAKARKDAGIKDGVRMHDARGTFVKDCVAAGGSFDSGRLYTGHRTSAMFDRYAGAGILEAQQRLAEKMAAARAERQAPSGIGRKAVEKIVPLSARIS
jgi:integrase